VTQTPIIKVKGLGHRGWGILWQLPAQLVTQMLTHDLSVVATLLDLILSCSHFICDLSRLGLLSFIVLRAACEVHRFVGDTTS